MEKRQGSSDNIRVFLTQLASEEYCYVTTTGRISGRPHEIEIWFGIQEKSLYLLSGGGDRSDWVKNLLKDPSVTVRIAQHAFSGKARVVENPDEEQMARRLLAKKYQSWREGRKLSNWARTALPVAIDLKVESP